MDVTSLYTNIPQEEEIQTVCKAYDTFYEDTPPIPTGFTCASAQANTTEKLVPVLWKKITYKHTEPPWALKWWSLLPIYLWAKSKQKSLAK